MQERRTPPPAPLLSARARALGLQTLQDVEQEYRAQKEGWDGTRPHQGYPPGPQGLAYHCPLCDTDFATPGGARKHVRSHGHRVLRVDWLEDGWLAWAALKARERDARTHGGAGAGRES